MEPAQPINEDRILAEAVRPDLAVLDNKPPQPLMAQHTSSSADNVRVCQHRRKMAFMLSGSEQLVNHETRCDTLDLSEALLEQA